MRKNLMNCIYEINFFSEWLLSELFDYLSKIMMNGILCKL